MDWPSQCTGTIYGLKWMEMNRVGIGIAVNSRGLT
jgi:hypothetical protein